MKRPVYKAINFDLDTKKLKEYFENYTQAYTVLGETLNSLGFEHRQGSDSISVKPITNGEILAHVTNITKKLNWLLDCIKKFDVTVIGKTFDMTDIIRNNSVSHKAIAKDKLPKAISYQRDGALRGEVAATQTLNSILDFPAKAVAKSNTSQVKNISRAAASAPRNQKKKAKRKDCKDNHDKLF